MPGAPPPVNVAVTLFAADMVTAHALAVPVHAPLQPLKSAPEAGAAVSVTVDPAVWPALHVEPPLPQLMPLPVTRPAPVTETES